jgi:hypothetical protein
MFKKSLLALALAGASMGAHALVVDSLTIVEIGGVAGMTMSAATASNSVAASPFVGESGGIFYFSAVDAGDGATPAAGSKVFGTTNTTDNFFAPPGNTTAGQITMGVVQTTGEMSDGFRYGGTSNIFTFAPNSVNGALSGTWTGIDGPGQLTLNFAGFGGFWNASGINYNLSPDTGMTTNVQTISGVTYYTADWQHTITAQEDPDFAGQRADWHIEGVMVSSVPEASTYGMMLVGLGLVGFAARRRKQA